MTKREPMSEQQLQLLVATMPGEWGAQEIGLDGLKTLGIAGPTIVGGAYSGVSPGMIETAEQMYGLEVVIGLTVLRHEINPKSGEPEGNADHYVFTKTTDSRRPYMRHGPFRGREGMAQHAGIPHWHTVEEFGEYIEGIRPEIF